MRCQEHRKPKGPHKEIFSEHQDLAEKGRQQVGRAAASGATGSGMYIVIVTHSLERLPELMCSGVSGVMGVRKEDETEGRKEGWLTMWNFLPTEHCDWLKQNSNKNVSHIPLF